MNSKGKDRMKFLSSVMIVLVFGLTASMVFGQDVYDQVSKTDKLVKEYPIIYAITNVRVVVGNGQIIGNTTIVIKHGLIDAIGANVRIPNEAELVDGTGMTVYPGFIDIYTNLGFSPPPDQGGRGRGGFQPPQPSQPQSQDEPEKKPNKRAYDPNLRPDKTAIDDLDFNDENFKKAREAGITAAVSINREGVFPGISSLVSTLGDDPVLNVIKSPLGAQYITYANIRGGYPNTLMGVVAFQRQSLMDAKYYMDLEERFEKSGRGMQRPVFDPVLRSLFPVVSGEQLVVFPVNTENEIKRAVSLAKQFNLIHTLVGVVEGYRVIDLLKEEGVPLTVSVNYPEPDQTTGYSFNMPFKPYEKTPPAESAQTEIEDSTKTEDEDSEKTELEKLIEEQLHGNAAKLYEAGIRFWITAGGEYDKFLDNVRLAVEAGLPADVALAKLTIEVAEQLNVADVLGTVETGKIANLILADGNIFDSGTAIKHVFVDGKKEDIDTAPAEGPKGGGRR